MKSLSLCLVLATCSIGGYAIHSDRLDTSAKTWRMQHDFRSAALSGTAVNFNGAVTLKATTISGAIRSGGSMGPLRKLPSNPRYFTADGVTAVYLTGSHNWQNLVDGSPTDPPAAFGYARYITNLKRWHHNFIRLWAWDVTHDRNQSRKHVYFYSPQPFVRSGPGKALDGKPKFNLRRLNQAYFDRLRRRIIQARNAGIYVGIMLFEGYTPDKGPIPKAYQGHPFASENNVNGIDGDVNDDRRANEIYRLPSEGGLRTINDIQKAYVRKVIDSVNDLDNVLYEIANEAPSATTSWQYKLINYIKGYEARKPKQHPVGMTFQWADGDNTALFKSRADWVSPRDAMSDLPAASGAKVILSDTDHHCGICSEANGDWAWKEFSRGRNPILMDAYGNKDWHAFSNAADVSARKAMGDTRKYANRMNLAAMTPQGELSSTGYALANAGKEYVVYQPHDGAFTLNLAGQTRKTFAVEWYDVKSGSTSTEAISGGATITLTPPGVGAAVAYLRAIPNSR